MGVLRLGFRVNRAIRDGIPRIGHDNKLNVVLMPGAVDDIF